MRAEKPTAQQFRERREELPDLVKICTKAARFGYGDLVWLSWMGGPGKRSGEPGSQWRAAHPAHASTALGVSAQGAHKLRELWQHIDKGHFDVSLLRALQSNARVRGRVQASFCFPPVGHFITHQSGVEKGVRRSTWHHPYVQEGTRKLHPVDKHRTLHEFCAKGDPPVGSPSRFARGD